MERLLSVLKGQAKRALRYKCKRHFLHNCFEITLKFGTHQSFGNHQSISFKNERTFRTTTNKEKRSNSLHQYYWLVKCNNIWLFSIEHHTALKSVETISKVVQRLPNYLTHSFYKYTQIYIASNKSLLLLTFEKWLEITVHQYFNPIANIVSSQESYKSNQRTSQEFT